MLRTCVQGRSKSYLRGACSSDSVDHMDDNESPGPPLQLRELDIAYHGKVNSTLEMAKNMSGPHLRKVGIHVGIHNNQDHFAHNRPISESCIKKVCSIESLEEAFFDRIYLSLVFELVEKRSLTRLEIEQIIVASVMTTKVVTEMIVRNSSNPDIKVIVWAVVYG